MARWSCARFRCLNAIAAILFVSGTAAFALAQQAVPHVELKDGAFRLIGWTGDLQTAESQFKVYVSGADDSTTMLGTYSIKGDTVEFRPRFSLAPGVGYHGTFPGGGFVMDPPPVRLSDTRVEHVYPSAGILPSNNLKLYIYFSAPMSRGEAWQHIHLQDDAGTPVELAFLELDQELWDPNNRRLTVLFDPGRIKRGLVPTNELGTPIVEGKHYKLVIDPGWHDANGAPMKKGFEKVFTGGPSDRTPPDPKRWTVTAPKAGTSDPLVVEFPKPMDYALLQRMIEVAGVDGAVTIDRNETRWQFTPKSPWKAGAYYLVADNLLEDISGNHLDRPFDVDLLQSPVQTGSAKTSSLAFSVR